MQQHLRLHVRSRAVGKPQTHSNGDDDTAGGHRESTHDNVHGFAALDLGISQQEQGVGVGVVGEGVVENGGVRDVEERLDILGGLTIREREERAKDREVQRPGLRNIRGRR